MRPNNCAKAIPKPTTPITSSLSVSQLCREWAQPLSHHNMGFSDLKVKMIINQNVFKKKYHFIPPTFHSGHTIARTFYEYTSLLIDWPATWLGYPTFATPGFDIIPIFVWRDSTAFELQTKKRCVYHKAMISEYFY